MEFYSDIDLAPKAVLKNLKLEQNADYPLDPEKGSVEFIRNRVMLCVEVDGSPFWLPLTQELNTYIHTQTEPALEWEVVHNLNTSTPIIQIFDADNKVVNPDSIESTSPDSALVKVLTPLGGRAICVIGDAIGLPREDVGFKTEIKQASATWVIPHGLGYEPHIRCVINGMEVQGTVVHDSLTTATVTFDKPYAGRAYAS